LARPVFQGEPDLVNAQSERLRRELALPEPCPPVLLVERSISEVPGFQPTHQVELALQDPASGTQLTTTVSLGQLHSTSGVKTILLLRCAPPERSGFPLGMLMTPVRIVATLKPPVIVSLLRVFTSEESATGLQSVVALTDHINMAGRNPLFGTNVDGWGQRFFDVQSLYSPTFNPKLRAAITSVKSGATVTGGLVLYGIGPVFESRCAHALLTASRAIGWAHANIPEHLVIHHMKVSLVALGVVSTPSVVEALHDAVAVVSTFLHSL
jgi:hypothetical protein